MGTQEQAAIIAAIQAQLDTHLQYIRRDFDELKETLASLQQNGCEMGRANRTEIERIKTDAEKRGTIGGAVGGGAIGVIVAVVAGILEYLQKRGP